MQFTIPPVQGKKVLKLQQHLKPNTNISWKKKSSIATTATKDGNPRNLPSYGNYGKTFNSMLQILQIQIPSTVNQLQELQQHQ